MATQKNVLNTLLAQRIKDPKALKQAINLAADIAKNFGVGGGKAAASQEEQVKSPVEGKA